jgi:cell division septum initiation protein DivIVA
MAQSQAQNVSSSNESTTDQVKDLRKKADDVSKEARNLVDRVVTYTKANPVEAAAIAAGIAFIAGGIILGPRLLQSRQQRDYDRLLSRAYREAERIRDDSTTWNRLTDWVRANVPSPNTWR